MRRISNTYFKQMPDEPALMSGANLPPVEYGPFEFERCDFHPRLWEALEQIYRPAGCVFVECNWSPKG